MGNVGPITWFHSNMANDPCPYCDAVQGHKPWCLSANVNMRYAFEAAWGRCPLTAGDILILHSLGAIW